MTCIVGCEEGGNAYIGADACGVRGYTNRAMSAPKVFRTGPFVIGYSGSFRMGQLLQYSLVVPPQNGEDDHKYMVCTFMDAVRDCLKKQGYLKTENGREGENGHFLVGYRGGLYRAEGDLQIGRRQDGLVACGGGEEYALAVMRALRTREPSPVNRIKEALSVSAYFNGAVMPPFTVLSTDVAKILEEG